MKKLILISILSFSAVLFAQEPGMVIEIKIKNPHLVGGDESSQYHVNIDQRMYARNPKEYGGIFIFSDSYPYYSDEEIGFDIIHKNDTMHVKFKLGNFKDFTNHDYIFFSRFIFEIPFSPGCYRISQFLMNDESFTLPSSTLWKDLKCDTCCHRN